APRTMTQRTESSADSASTASPSERHISLVSALSFSGRLSVIVAMVPSRPTLMRSSMGSPIEELDQAEPGHGYVGHEQQHAEQHADEPDVHARDVPDRRLGDRARDHEHAGDRRRLLSD